MATFATVDDLRDSYFEGDIPEALNPKLEVKLDEAERMVARWVPGRDIAAFIAAGHATANDVKQVLCNMVLRIVRNPGGASSQSAGPFSMTLDRQVAAGRLLLTRDDRRLLGLQTGATSVEMVDDALPHLARSPHRPNPVYRSNRSCCEDELW